MPIFPSLGHWEIDGKPVSSEEAEYGLNPDAVWVRHHWSADGIRILDPPDA